VKLKVLSGGGLQLLLDPGDRLLADVFCLLGHKQQQSDARKQNGGN